ncbi:5-(carboxyamino)imidazole ribonucleotide synthase [Sphingomonas sp.]|uniref:5-(carboxyamino)imidazole ribonucleotide synthase n=1 Tax=Sphingomonas sp. TaxID=28214 RepID=UPI00286CB40D|nr:5-(carboxyamino)imidazole ribonucleotide synthase [Sphingomonas sp.]
MIVAPGSTIGIIGGGQLGRMLAMAAAELGYRCHIFAPDDAPCAAAVAAAHTQAAFDDAEALGQFAAAVDVVTYEFENLPVAPLAALGAKMRPGARSLASAQDRCVEKEFVASVGGRVAPWRTIDGPNDVAAAIAALGLPLVLKSRRFGYDGKGQAWVRDPSEARDAWDAIGAPAGIAEAAIDFLAEFSVVLARTEAGECALWDSPRNTHESGILRRSELPAGDPIERQVGEAQAIARRIADALGHIGVLTVEFFACADGPLVNEIAPRVHNSGHWTIEGAETSQFEQHIRAVCGLPLGSTKRTARQVAMTNLIGDEADDWAAPLAESGTHLHLYGKGEARPGRKMGHVTHLN